MPRPTVSENLVIAERFLGCAESAVSVSMSYKLCPLATEIALHHKHVRVKTSISRSRAWEPGNEATRPLAYLTSFYVGVLPGLPPR